MLRQGGGESSPVTASVISAPAAAPISNAPAATAAIRYPVRIAIVSRAIRALPSRAVIVAGADHDLVATWLTFSAMFAAGTAPSTFSLPPGPVITNVGVEFTPAVATLSFICW